MSDTNRLAFRCQPTSRATMPRLSIHSSLGALLDNDASKRILEKYLPGILTHPRVGMGRRFALTMVAGLSDRFVTDAVLEKIDAELKTLV
ncbi:hypothetical protein NX786_14365 [Telluria mixta]|uniref:Uncharacterized protein n=1 Tax=Telluria mixta TaxID=34071 RepID=A0ABT2BZF0_9BURK|nr:hypothetical protein [Telluria mixta]MCS0630520.1 hypothetical protein [Telluria mixta]WEM94175.1 hypothetical protein P0M04_22130 [Telluria mixta]